MIKKHLTFSDLLQAVKIELWKHASDHKNKAKSQKALTETITLSEMLSVVGF